MKAKLIVIDGVDGCGKGTQIKLLKKALSGESVIFTREPGGTPFAEDIRELILAPRTENIPPETDFFLFWAGRIAHLRNMVMPAIENGTGVISDRLDSSTYAFQICGEENKSLNEFFFEVRDRFLESLNIQPFYIFLDLHPEISAERMVSDKKRDATHFDLRPLEYHMRVRDGFNQFAARIPFCQFVDASREIDEVFADVIGTVKKRV